MQLRRFTADSTPAALGAVRLALGDDAIILANRRLGDQVEIIATGQIEDAETMAAMSSEQQHSETSLATELPEVNQTELERVADAVANTAQMLHKNVGEPETPQPPPVVEDDVVDISALSEAIESESAQTQPLGPLGELPQDISLADSAPLSGQSTQSSHGVNGKGQGTSHTSDTDARHTSASIDRLTAALDAQSDLINNHFKSLEVNLWGTGSPDRSAHLQQLFAVGIGAELAIRLVERTEPGTALEVALRQSFALLKSTLPIGNDKTLAKPGVTVVSGAPGSGKTTALVKLATEHVKHAGTQSIVIICADTRRIGAFEELQAYGRLLGVPTVHAHDTAELDSLLHAFTHKQLVLIDHTLHGEEDAVGLPERLLEGSSTDSVRYLFALSASTQSATAEALISAHCQQMPVQCVLTHLDTSARLGELFNAIIRHHLPIAYWSDSASVQRPLQKADASVLVATAVAMSRRISVSPDDLWLQRLIQPSQSVLPGMPLAAGQTALQAS